MAEPTAASTPAIDAGSYELLRDRLLEQARVLGERADALNARRIELFGGSEMSIAGQARIRTANNCVPRDIAAIGKRLLFGYNVHLGFRQEMTPEDVFSLQELTPEGDALSFKDVAADDPDHVLQNKTFREDFQNLYRYMKDARLLQLHTVGPKLLAVFQIGTTIKDIKVLQWNLTPDGRAHYLNGEGAREHVFPPSHDFEWSTTSHVDFVKGRHAHVNIRDKVFVETVGGDLTIKVEDNTDDGTGIYSEPVDDPDQSLEDAKILFAEIGTLVLLKILPFGEHAWRYLVFNTRTQAVNRIDAIGRACVQLPEDHGIIFPGGYYLASGETKSFEGHIEGMRFARVVRSPNGEDVMYVFYEETTGRSILLPYNLIRKEVVTPIHAHGFTIFDDGAMIVFRAESQEAARVHGMHIWRTPFCSDSFAAQQPASAAQGTYLGKIGNAELVRGISDAHSVRKMIREQEATAQIYEDLIAACTRLGDTYAWLGHKEVALATLVKDILATAELIIDEFEKVQVIQGSARDALAAAEEQQKKLFSEVRPDGWSRVDQFVSGMAKLRTQRGKLISLKEMRYMQVDRVDALEAAVAQAFEHLTQKAVTFLLRDDALAPYREKADAILARVETVKKSNEATPLQAELDETAQNLDLLSEVLSTLKIDDPEARTRILEQVSEVYALFNRAKAVLAGRRKDLLSHEGVAEFGAQFKLFAQSVQSGLALADTPEKCDEQLSRLMVQLEELEARFSEFDRFLGDVAQKREEVYDAFSAKKQQLLDERQRRADNLDQAAKRILEGVARRAGAFKELDELNAYFASDAMILKVRDLATQLATLGDNMRAENVLAALKAGRDEAARALRDKTELFEDGDNVIRFGKHRFAVSTQPLDLTLLPRDGRMTLHLTGTSFFEGVDDARLEATRPFWEQSLVSETPQVYRGEYLAACMLFAAELGEGALTLEALGHAQLEGRLLEVVREYSASRYDEGYERGVHDHDAALILDKVLALRSTAGLLRFGPGPRSLAGLFWHSLERDSAAPGPAWKRTGQNLGRLRETFASTRTLRDFANELGEAIGAFVKDAALPYLPRDIALAGSYLAEELAEPDAAFTISAEATRLRAKLFEHLELARMRSALEQDLDALRHDLTTRFTLAQAWCEAFVEKSDKPEIRALKPVVREAAALLIAPSNAAQKESGALSGVEVSGLFGQHASITGQKMTLRLDEFLERLSAYVQDHVPGFKAFRALRHEIVEREKAELRLEEFKPRVLSSFVRNKLINDVYLPLIGDNLAKQIGAHGEGKRTDLMGMLLLISPPGYGKTTLMEYVASRLGLVFMKINGPALGHSVTSIDPGEAPNATARQELQKLNLALEMGNNVMLYVDDIQHTHPEFLQKFISLCDAQRRIEGVWRGRTRTYDLRGRRFCVCMAGNPYTESGESFQIPDMLANRSDVYNLGDVLSGKGDAFALSYLENAITSNKALAPLATREQGDIYALVRMAQGEDVPASALKQNISKVEQEEIVAIFQKLFACRDVLLKVNATYISSAAQDDRFRTEPRFQLQGSYRNMNKLAEKVVAAMNAQELEALLDDHYQGEAQTLTIGAEANLLKLKELRGTLTPAQAARWEEIKSGFRRHQLNTGDDDDPVTRVTNQLSALREVIERVGGGWAAASGDARASRPTNGEQALRAALQSLVAEAERRVRDGEAAVPADVVLETLKAALAEGEKLP